MLGPRVRKGGSVNSCAMVSLGLIGWAEADALQKRVVAARKAGAVGDVLLLCEHPHTITLGRSGKAEHLLAGENVLRQKGVEFHATDRGGDITYHGPGQLVGYPIVHLAAIGVHLSRWVTSHGFAYNVATDLRYFDLIVPCGIAERRATSLEKLLGGTFRVSEVSERISRHLGEVLNLDVYVTPRVQFLRALEQAETSAQRLPREQTMVLATPGANVETVRSDV